MGSHLGLRKIEQNRLAKRFLRVRKQMAWTQSEMASEMGVSTPVVVYIENSLRSVGMATMKKFREVEERVKGGARKARGELRRVPR